MANQDEYRAKAREALEKLQQQIDGVISQMGLVPDARFGSLSSGDSAARIMLRGADGVG